MKKTGSERSIKPCLENWIRKMEESTMSYLKKLTKTKEPFRNKIWKLYNKQNGSKIQQPNRKH